MQHEGTETTWCREGWRVVGDLLAALGKGFGIGCAGLVIAALFGGPAAAAASVWTILATGIGGSACMAMAAAIRRERREAEEAHRQEVRELVSLVRDRPVIEIVSLDPRPPGKEPFVALLERAETRGGGRGR